MDWKGLEYIPVDGEPVKDNYRRFRIKRVGGADDYAMLYEVLQRRLSKGEKIAPLPNLIVVDGGKGQLTSAVKVIQEQDLKLIDAVALAKGRGKKTIQGNVSPATPEQLFIPHRKNPIILPPQSPTLLLLKRIRDESHRFAQAYYRRGGFSGGRVEI